MSTPKGPASQSTASQSTASPGTAPTCDGGPLLAVPGFSWLGENIGIKDDTPDFAVAVSERDCAAAAVFTRNNFPGAPVVVGREHVADGLLRAVVVNSKNANVATGPDGVEAARRMCRGLGAALGMPPEQVLPSSTGVIGVPLPVALIEAACAGVPQRLSADTAALSRFARAIMTTDTVPKLVSRKVGGATISGVAKGAGMIEPHMATMLAYFFTDAALPAGVLRPMLARVVERSFNRISVDTDTSTSDTVLVLANGAAGPVDEAAFEAAFADAAGHLARAIARDGEGATKLIELTVEQAPSQRVALAIAKSVVNSPLVKTAIHGADPNWGRFVMAIGKVFEHPVPLENLRITFGGAPDADGADARNAHARNADQGADALVITATGQNGALLARISDYLRRDTVCIRIALGQGDYKETVWGCDLTAEYVRVNATYTT